MNSFMQRAEDVKRDWHLVNAEGCVLGRLASKIAEKLIGKHKPTYTFHIDDGDYVVVLNTKKLVATGKKLRDKIYYRHSGHLGNLKSRTLGEYLEKDSNKVLELAVRRMLPKNRIGRHMLTRLRLFSDAEHSHQAQNPKPIQI